MICPNGKAVVKVHGFGVTAHEYLLRYPWWSVDSTTWTKKGGFGTIFMPKKRQGEYIFTPQDLIRLGLPVENWAKTCGPWSVFISEESPQRFQAGSMHYDKLKPAEQKVIRDWLDHINVPLGTHGGEWDGVITDHNQRRIVNLRFFEILREKLPTIKNARWQPPPKIGFGLHSTKKLKKPKTKAKIIVPKTEKPIIFYSGCSSIASQPEVVLGTEANVMLTYHDFHKKNKPDSRFRRILEARGHKFDASK